MPATGTPWPALSYLKGVACLMGTIAQRGHFGAFRARQSETGLLIRGSFL